MSNSICPVGENIPQVTVRDQDTCKHLIQKMQQCRDLCAFLFCRKVQTLGRGQVFCNLDPSFCSEVKVINVPTTLSAGEFSCIAGVKSSIKDRKFGYIHPELAADVVMFAFLVLISAKPCSHKLQKRNVLAIAGPPCQSNAC